MKSLIVATDLSERSDRALARAASLAGRIGARLTVAHIVDSDLPADVAAAQRQAAEASLTRQLAAMGITGAELSVTTGDASVTLPAMSEAAAADLVILGLHRRRPILDRVRGSTMERIVRASQRPVLLVAAPVRAPYARALCGIDLSPACVAAVRVAAEIAPDAAITCFHAFHIAFRELIAPGGRPEDIAPYIAEAREEVERWCAGAGLPPRAGTPRMIEAEVREALRTMLAEVAPDLLAIGAHGRPALYPNLLGSFAADLVRDPPCDLLIVRR
jgi:nucleotide-binding universal stress UspA family protein